MQGQTRNAIVALRCVKMILLGIRLREKDTGRYLQFLLPEGTSWNLWEIVDLHGDGNLLIRDIQLKPDQTYWSPHLSS